MRLACAPGSSENLGSTARVWHTNHPQQSQLNRWKTARPYIRDATAFALGIWFSAVGEDFLSSGVRELLPPCWAVSAVRLVPPVYNTRFSGRPRVSVESYISQVPLRNSSVLCSGNKYPVPPVFPLVDLVTRSTAGNTVDTKFCLRGWIVMLWLGKRWEELRKLVETLPSMSETNKV